MPMTRHRSIDSSSPSKLITTKQARLQGQSSESGRAMAMAAEREGAVVTTGHDECMKAAAAMLEEFGLPLGLLPLADVQELGFVRDTGYFWIAQRGQVQHQFKKIGKQVSYDVQISAYVQPKAIKKLKGVKAKELMLWPPINEMSVDDPPTGKIHFKSLAGVTKTFPVEAFAAGQ
ncbi:hypothetical protein BS78_09G243300 [Paspalum vaginatum]|nr:hypothetical protein BS78_09G243300 [Paspalum vaginatum]